MCGAVKLSGLFTDCCYMRLVICFLPCVAASVFSRNICRNLCQKNERACLAFIYNTSCISINIQVEDCTTPMSAIVQENMHEAIAQGVSDIEVCTWNCCRDQSFRNI